MDGKQFEEIMITLTDIAGRISLGFERLKNSIENNNNKLNEHDDLDGIPLDSVHHPKNPKYNNNSKYMWNKKQHMWRSK